MSGHDSNNFSDDDSINGCPSFNVIGCYDESCEDTKLSSPNDYLLSVMHEAKNLPTVVKIKPTKAITNKLGLSNRLIFESNYNTKMNNLVMSEANQKIVNNFAELKIKLENIKTQKLFTKYKKIPNKKDTEAWLEFCIGPNRTEPVVSVICSLQRIQIMKLLDVFAEFESETFTHEMGSWIYALLSVLATPIEPDTIYALRCIARFLIKSIKRLDGSDKTLNKAINAIVVIVIYEFNQKDLLNEF